MFHWVFIKIGNAHWLFTVILDSFKLLGMAVYLLFSCMREVIG